jgi:hypothetical protein
LGGIAGSITGGLTSGGLRSGGGGITGAAIFSGNFSTGAMIARCGEGSVLIRGSFGGVIAGRTGTGVTGRISGWVMGSSIW